jgi:large subunit ribosomal protein L15
MKLNELRDNDGATKKRMRVGRGRSSGKGKTSGRGIKGQKARTGVSVNGFEGGQMPIYRRLPKRGFNNPNAMDFQVVNLGRLQQAFEDKVLDASKVIDAAALKAAGVIAKISDGVRILAKGALKTKASFRVSGASETAKSAIEKAGGSVELVDAKTFRAEKLKPAKPSAKKAKAAEKPAKKPAVAKKVAPAKATKKSAE